jgi:6-phosphogluconolactonase
MVADVKMHKLQNVTLSGRWNHQGRRFFAGLDGLRSFRCVFEGNGLNTPLASGNRQGPPRLLVSFLLLLKLVLDVLIGPMQRWIEAIHSSCSLKGDCRTDIGQDRFSANLHQFGFLLKVKCRFARTFIFHAPPTLNDSLKLLMKLFTSFFLLIGVLAMELPAADSLRLYFGSIAKEDRGGIYTALLDRESGRLGVLEHVGKIAGAGFLVLHPSGRYLYSTGSDLEVDGTKTGRVHAFGIAESGVALTELGAVASGGSLACHISLDPSAKHLLVANYLGGSCAVIPVKPDGSLSPASFVQKHTGSSVHPKRQTAPFTHAIHTDPAGRHVLVADLGIDKIMTYRFDVGNGTLSPADPAFVATEAGGGPRHFTFHPSGKFVYANLELSNKVVAYRYDAEKGSLADIQSINALPDGFEGPSTTSEILTTPDGRFLYVANRGHNSLSIFSVDSESGKLTLVGHEPSRGETPRNFYIEPSGTFLIATNAKPGNAVVFRIDPQEGRLTFTGSEIEVPNPGCVRGAYPRK